MQSNIMSAPQAFVAERNAANIDGECEELISSSWVLHNSGLEHISDCIQSNSEHEHKQVYCDRSDFRSGGSDQFSFSEFSEPPLPAGPLPRPYFQNQDYPISEQQRLEIEDEISLAANHIRYLNRALAGCVPYKDIMFIHRDRIKYSNSLVGMSIPQPINDPEFCQLESKVLDDNYQIKPKQKQCSKNEYSEKKTFGRVSLVNDLTPHPIDIQDFSQSVPKRCSLDLDPYNRNEQKSRNFFQSTSSSNAMLGNQITNIEKTIEKMHSIDIDNESMKSSNDLLSPHVSFQDSNRMHKSYEKLNVERSIEHLNRHKTGTDENIKKFINDDNLNYQLEEKKSSEIEVEDLKIQLKKVKSKLKILQSNILEGNDFSQLLIHQDRCISNLRNLVEENSRTLANERRAHDIALVTCQNKISLIEDESKIEMSRFTDLISALETLIERKEAKIGELYSRIGSLSCEFGMDDGSRRKQATEILILELRRLQEQTENQRKKLVQLAQTATTGTCKFFSTVENNSFQK